MKIIIMNSPKGSNIKVGDRLEVLRETYTEYVTSKGNVKKKDAEVIEQ